MPEIDTLSLNTKSPVLAPRQASSTLSSAKISGFTSTSERQQSIKLIAQRLGEPESVVARLLRKISGGSPTATFDTIRQLLDDPAMEARYSARPQQAQQQKPELASKNPKDVYLADHQSHDLLESRVALQANFKSNFLQQQEIFKTIKPEHLSNKFGDAELQHFVPLLNREVLSPKAFASLFVNYRAAYVLERTNPQALNFLLAYANKNIQLPASFWAQLANLAAQSLKLKQTKSTALDDEERVEEERKQEALLEESDHQNHTVKGIREAIRTTPLKPLQDYLLEAERFAEEEIANIWSITLKKEKELEKRILARLKMWKWRRRNK